MRVQSLRWEYGNLLQYSRLENFMDGGPWRATVHRAAKSWTQLSGIYIYVIYEHLNIIKIKKKVNKFGLITIVHFP